MKNSMKSNTATSVACACIPNCTAHRPHRSIIDLNVCGPPPQRFRCRHVISHRINIGVSTFHNAFPTNALRCCDVLIMTRVYVVWNSKKNNTATSVACACTVHRSSISVFMDLRRNVAAIMSFPTALTSSEVNFATHFPQMRCIGMSSLLMTRACSVEFGEKPTSTEHRSIIDLNVCGPPTQHRLRRRHSQVQQQRRRHSFSKLAS